MARIPRHYIHEGDLSPVLYLSVTKESDGTVYNFTGHTGVIFSMTKKGSITPAVDGSTATIVSASSVPQLAYNWVAGDTDEFGVYEGVFHSVDIDGKPVSFPNDGFIEVYVLKKLRTS